MQFPEALIKVYTVHNDLIGNVTDDSQFIYMQQAKTLKAVGIISMTVAT